MSMKNFRPARTLLDATGLSRGGSRLSLQGEDSFQGCHGLVPWRFTFVATRRRFISGMPRACPVEVHVCRYPPEPQVAASVRLHGTSPWHLEDGRSAL